MCDKNHDF